MQSDRLTRLIGYALITLAVLVQLQATIQIGGTLVRANAADIALAVLAPIILFAFFSYFTRLKEIAGPQLLVLVVAISLLLSFSLFRGYEVISGLSIWAAIKYAGWYILLYYLALGALIAIVAGPAGKERFALGFIGFQVVVIVAFIVLRYSGFTWVIVGLSGRLDGFAGNPNAMAFYLICGFALALAYTGRTGLSPRRGMAVFAAASVIFSGILFTRSLAALIAIVFVLLFAAIIRVTTLKRLAQVLTLGLSLWMIPQVVGAPAVNIVSKLSKIVAAGSTSGAVTGGTSGAHTGNASRYDATVSLRMEGYLDALAMWRAHPVFGAGLGVYLHRQSIVKKPIHWPVQIHNTGLWLLAEVGLTGFLVIAGIFIVLFHKVWCLARSPPGEPGSDVWYQSAVLLILIGWAVSALFGELMYQRVGWLLAGMALTAPVEPLIFWKRNPVRTE